MPAGLTVAATPVLARALGATDYGVLALATTVVLVGAALLFGWGEIVAVRELVDPAASVTSTLSDVSVLMLGAALIPMVIALVAGAAFDNLGLWLITGGLVCISGFALFCSGAYRAVDDARGYVRNSVLSSTGRFIIGVPAALAGFGVEGVLAGWLIGGAVAGALAARRLGISGEGLRLGRPKSSTLSYALPLIPVALSMTSLSLIDRLILGVYSPARVVGLYALGYSLVEQTLTIVISVLLAGQFPRMLAEFDKHGPKAASDMLARGIDRLLSITLGLGLVLALFGQHLVTLVGGSAFAHSSVAFMPFVVGGVILLGLGQYAAIPFQQTRATHLWARAAALGALVNVGLDFLLVPKHGPLGAGISTAFGYGVFFTGSALLSRRTPVRPYRSRHLLLPAVALNTGLATWALLHAELPWPFVAALTLIAYSLGLVLSMRLTTGSWLPSA